jgi:hypothetical protein
MDFDTCGRKAESYGRDAMVQVTPAQRDFSGRVSLVDHGTSILEVNAHRGGFEPYRLLTTLITFVGTPTHFGAKISGAKML